MIKFFPCKHYFFERERGERQKEDRGETEKGGRDRDRANKVDKGYGLNYIGSSLAATISEQSKLIINNKNKYKVS